MVVCKNAEVELLTGVPAVRGLPRSPLMNTEQSVHDLFVAFTHDHHKGWNLLFGSFSLLVENPRALDFDNKHNYFNPRLRQRVHLHYGSLPINASVFEDSFHAFQHKSSQVWRADSTLLPGRRCGC